MDYEKKIEIPFGAKDSELCECEYTIPEGYETEIKDGKVIIRKKEPEDEKTRKSLLKYLKDMCKSTSTPFSLADAKLWIAWLEKQGKQKPTVVPKFKVGDTIHVKDSHAEYTINSISDGLYHGNDGWFLAIGKEDDYELVENPITATDRGTPEEIIINLKRVEKDYRIDLTKEITWVRNKAQKGE